jgi:hypothetical protein
MRYDARFCLTDIADPSVKPNMTAHDIKKHLEALNDEMDRMKVKGGFTYMSGTPRSGSAAR